MFPLHPPWSTAALNQQVRNVLMISRHGVQAKDTRLTTKLVAVDHIHSQHVADAWVWRRDAAARLWLSGGCACRRDAAARLWSLCACCVDGMRE